VREAHEVCGPAAVVSDLHEGALVVGLDDGAPRPRGPAPGRGTELDYVEDGVSEVGHTPNSVAPVYGISTQVETSRGGCSPAMIQIAATGAVAPLRPSTSTTVS
jgi:hypothetical protein